MLAIDDLRTLFRFNAWANDRMRRAVASLPEEKLYIDMKNSFGSIHGTLVHMVGAEDIWLQRLNGADPGVFMTPAAYATWNSVEAKWKEVEAGHAAFIAAVPEGMLDRTLTFHNMKGEIVSQKVWMALQHLVNHSTYHRGQITTLVRQAGGTPIGTDLILFYRQQGV